MKLTKRYTLYFGSTAGTGGASTDVALREFLATNVTPLFPGFTLSGAQGFWNGEAELTRVLVILGAARDLPAVVAIGSAYAERFRQESVLIETADISAVFVGGSCS